MKPFKSRPLVQALESYLKRKDYGDFVSYEEMSNVVGIDIRDYKYRYILESAKRALLRHHDKVLINIRGKGYEIGTAPTIITESSSRRKRAFNTVKGGYEIVQTVDLSKLSYKEKDRAINEQAKNALLLVCYKATENKLLNDPEERIILSQPTETSIIKMLLDRSKS